MEFSKTQLGSVVEQMKQAMLAGIPVVYIPTDEMEIVNRILTTMLTPWCQGFARRSRAGCGS